LFIVENFVVLRLFDIDVFPLEDLPRYMLRPIDFAMTVHSCLIFNAGWFLFDVLT